MFRVGGRGTRRAALFGLAAVAWGLVVPLAANVSAAPAAPAQSTTANPSAPITSRPHFLATNGSAAVPAPVRSAPVAAAPVAGASISCAAPNLCYRGGPVLQSTKVYLIFWQPTNA